MEVIVSHQLSETTTTKAKKSSVLQDGTRTSQNSKTLEAKVVKAMLVALNPNVNKTQLFLTTKKAKSLKKL